MRCLFRKKSAFTLLELVIAMSIFTVLTLGFYSAMVSIYSNSKIEFYIGKKTFAGIEALEKAASLVHDRNLKKGEKLDVTYKNAVVSEVLHKQGDIRYVNEFEVFSSTPYKIKLDGYFLSRQILVGETFNSDDYVLTDEQEKAQERDKNVENYFVYFVPNDVKKELFIPEYDYVKILEKRSSADDGYATDYTYLNKILGGDRLLGAFQISEETKDLLYFEKLTWEFSRRKDKSGNYFLPLNRISPAISPIKPEYVAKAAKGDHYVEGASIYLDSDSLAVKYPNDSAFKNLKRFHKFYKETSETIEHDGFLRFSLEPVAKNMVKLNTIKTPGIWVLALPQTDNLLFHFDMALAHSENPVISGEDVVEEADFLRDLSASMYNDWTVKREFKSLDPRKKIKLYSHDKQFGKYIQLSNGEDLVFSNIRNINNEETEYSIFLVVDTDGASPGSILKQKNNVNKMPFCLLYDGAASFKITSDYYRNSGAIIEVGDASRSTHIIMIKAYEYLYLGKKKVCYNFKVDNFATYDVSTSIFVRTDKETADPNALNNPFILGGANGLKVKEIIAYKDSPYSSYKALNYRVRINSIYEYLYKKHIAP